MCTSFLMCLFCYYVFTTSNHCRCYWVTSYNADANVTFQYAPSVPCTANEPARNATPPSPYLPQRLCERTRVAIKRVNPYIHREESESRASRNPPTMSACLRCGACLAIAHSFNETLHKAQTSKLMDVATVRKMLRDSCDGFHSYGLRDYNGYRLISKVLPLTTHVPSPLDGTWGNLLREQCLIYLEEFGEWTLYIRWRSEAGLDLSSVLCRSVGLFRDCNNIDGPKVPDQSFLVKNVIRLEVPITVAMSLCFAC